MYNKGTIATVVLTAVLFVLAGASTCAQTAQIDMTNSTSQPVQTIVLPSGGMPSTNTGTAFVIAWPSAPLLITPEAHLGTVPTSVGARNSTASNTAGATNATASLPVSTRFITMVPKYAGAAPTTVNSGAIEPFPAVESKVALTNWFDRGVGQALVGDGDSGGTSLGEIARESREHAAAVEAREYTNDEIEQIGQQAESQVGGVSGAAVDAGTVFGTQQPSPGSATAVAKPAGKQPATPIVSRPTKPE